MRRDGDMITLRIADDGIGIAAELIDSPVDSLGLKLIRGLSEDINADVRIENDNGTVIELQFKAGLLKTAPIPASSFNEKALYT
ncbi:hypothetical protein ACQ86N_15345 [Puia sp. P3]|uniref:hypothetical protein n=1 Tax=Puia sp. P3 TaxID=3423952 RepID=UPI003D667CB1